MLLTHAPALVLVALANTALAQLAAGEAEAALIGSWSSGSKNVRTGPSFANPVNMTFNYPPTTGIAYSFTDQFYEISRYRFNGNGSEPSCITGVLGWSHGRYQLNPNGSMTMTPFPDGYQQIQDPCAAVSENFIENYMITQEFYTGWQIFNDPTDGLKLHLFQFDGAPLAPMFKVSTTPDMLPTTLLRNVTNPGSPVNPNADPFQRPTAPPQRRSFSVSGASSRWPDGVWITGVLGTLVAACTSLL